MRIGIASHIVFDTLEGPDGTVKKSIGGPPCYAGLTSRQFGFEVSLATKVGKDIRTELRQFLIDAKIALPEKHVVDAPTTKFTIRIKDASRTLTLQEKCDGLQVDDFANMKVDCWLVSPVFDEVSHELFEAIKSRAGPKGFLMLDPQGYLRSADSDGKIVIMERITLNLSGVQAIKVDQHEMSALTGGKVGLAGMRELQSRGITFVVSTTPGEIHLLHKDIHYWAAMNEIETPDSTGAGDILSGAFCCAYVKEKDPLWALSFGAGAVKAALETGKIGLNKIPSFSKIEENASYFYNTIRFQQLS